MTPWGEAALGYKTRKTKNRTNKFIVKREEKIVGSQNEMSRSIKKGPFAALSFSGSMI